MRKLLGVMLVGAMVSGCATSSIPPERLKEYALLKPAEKTGGIVDATAIIEVDGKSVWNLSGSTEDVLPGRHNIHINTCFDGAKTCSQRIYSFTAQAGLKYVFRSPNQIEVFDRFNLKQPLYNLTQRGGSALFITPEEAKQIDDANQKVLAAQMDVQNKAQAAAQLALTERRKKNVPLVRKIGARVCQERERGMIYVGYVEGLAEEKVQIRYSESHAKGSTYQANGFQPTIVWDSPMNVDICE